MSQTQKANYMKHYEDTMLSGSYGFTWLRPAAEFDGFGLRFPIEYLNQVNKSIVLLPLELMAEYVDVICKTFIDQDDQEFIFKQILNEDPTIDDKRFENINATAVGNLAYVCLNCKNESARKITEKQIEYIFSRQKGWVLDQINESLQQYEG